MAGLVGNLPPHKHGHCCICKKGWSRFVAAGALWLFLTSGVLAQDLNSEPGAMHLYLIPEEVQDIAFLTHVVEVEVLQHPDLTAEYRTISSYRLHNETEGPVIVALTLQSTSDKAGEPAFRGLKQVRLFEGARPVTLELNQGGQYSVSIDLEPDERTRLDLHYVVPATGRYFPEVVYDVSPLRIWGDPPESMRFSVITHSELSQRTLQKIEPVNFQVQDGELRWLFENALPWSSFRVRFIHKAAWSQIRRAEQAEDNLTLGQLFHTLYMVNSDLPLGERQNFYDQALAALLLAVSEEPGLAHYSLAQLYRTQLFHSLLPGKSTYLERVLYHARLGLEFLPEESEIQRMDLALWLLDGLEMQISRGVQRGDWGLVNDALEEAETLPLSWVAEGRIEEIRHNTSMQQAIWLLVNDSPEEAAALVGSQSDDSINVPPADAVSVFQSWLVAVVADPASLAVTMEGTVTPSQVSRLPEKLTVLKNLTAQAGGEQQISWNLAEIPAEGASKRVLRLQLHSSDELQAQRLANLLGADADWILLQQILQEPWPKMSVQQHLLFQDMVYEYGLNLENVYRLWNAKALNLDQEAIHEASAGADGPEDLVRQFNFLDAAQNWRGLAKNSVVLVSLRTDAADLAQNGDSWVATQEHPRLQARTGSHSLRIPNLAISTSVLFAILVTFATWLSLLLRPRMSKVRMQNSRIQGIGL